MSYEAKILLDSQGPTLGTRLTTWELTYPRFVHAEFMTHRMFSRNAASSRAIPIEKMIERVMEDPAMPVWWGKNQKGMQAQEELSPSDAAYARATWLSQRDSAVSAARYMIDLNVHKQITNRLLEPWMWITVICSATTFSNFFHLRCHPDAQPEIKYLADMMQAEYYSHKPTRVEEGDWHLPLIQDDEHETFTTSYLKKLSVARCARVSYLTHDGRRDHDADIQLHDRLVSSGHWSPFEHVAQVGDIGRTSGNFRGWLQYRKEFEHEHQAIFRPSTSVG